ncbi:hypothetical protein [Saccharopolyspora spinosa]|uniref:hypothetical protein n=1 Tax=Saccharopolyspora spinosa TaxID=60894 RepID=UPI000237A422|nr:hypothetical protein [Saccharopolyspora spinosa]
MLNARVSAARLGSACPLMASRRRASAQGRQQIELIARLVLVAVRNHLGRKTAEPKWLSTQLSATRTPRSRQVCSALLAALPLLLYLISLLLATGG